MRAMRSFVLVVLAACGSSSPAPSGPSPGSAQPIAVPADAALPDAGLPAEVTTAPAWIFRYNTPSRAETWTLRYHGGQALLVVETKQGAMRYTGTAGEGDSMPLALAAGNNRLNLDCKHEKMPLSTKCNDMTAAKQDVLNCYHPDFKSPMTFGPAPGVEYVEQPGDCSGFRLVK